jgi:hypothetical protein
MSHTNLPLLSTRDRHSAPFRMPANEQKNGIETEDVIFEYNTPPLQDFATLRSLLKTVEQRV